MHISILSLILIIPVNFLLGMLVLSRDRRLRSNQYYSVSIFFICLWALGDALLLGAERPYLVEAGKQLFYIGPLFTALFLALFSLYFLSKPSRKIAYISLGLAVATVAIAAITATAPEFLVRDIIIEGSSNNSVIISRAGWLVYSAYFSLFFLFSYVVLLVKTHRSYGPERTQLEYVFSGIFLTSMLASVTNLVLPTFGETRFIWLGPVFTVFYVAATSTAILKHKLFDIRIFVIRASVYSLTTILLGVLYVAPIVFLLLKIMDLPFVLYSFIPAVVVGTVAATNYERLRNWFDKVTNRYFFRDAYDPAAMIAELNKALVGTIEIRRLLEATERVILKHLRPEICSFILLGDEEPSTKPRVIGLNRKTNESNVIEEILPLLEAHMNHNFLLASNLSDESGLKKALSAMDIALCLRLNSNDSEKNVRIGYVLMGIRKSGKPYDAVDLQVLDVVRNTLLIAMQNALHFEEIQHFNVTLQEKVDEATRKLRVTNEKLRKLDETKDEFISMASHQLRTPLTSVKGYVSMVLEGDAGELKPQQAEMLKQAFLSSERMVNLIADLLNLSRLNTGKFVIEPAPTDLRNVVEAELAQLHEAAKAKDITLTYVRPETFPTLMLDENKIHQVVMNFIDNALYYTPAKGKVEVSLTETPTAVEYRVKDNGIGVPKDLQHRLFTKFYRADNARRMRPDGTGLGLFMAKKVIIAQGGSIIFDSEEGKGSTFGFHFNKAALADGAKTILPDDGAD